MKGTWKFVRHAAPAGLLCVLLCGATGSAVAQVQIESRTAAADGVKLHYSSAAMVRR